MRKYLLLGIALICHAAPAQAAENSSKRYTIEQLMASDTIGGLTWSTDDTKLIFTSNRTSIANIHEMPSDSGTPTHLTHSVSATVTTISDFTQQTASGDQSGKGYGCQLELCGDAI